MDLQIFNFLLELPVALCKKQCGPQPLHEPTKTAPLRLRLASQDQSEELAVKIDQQFMVVFLLDRYWVNRGDRQTPAVSSPVRQKRTARVATTSR